MSLIPVSSTAPTYFEINNNEAAKVQATLMKEWKPKREVWPLIYGEYIMGISAGISGLIINSIFRKKLKLLHHGWFLTTASLALAPTFVATINHNHYVTRKFLLYEKDCLACPYLKGISLVEIAGIIYPAFTAPLINIAIATNLGFRVPYITEVREVLKFWWSTVRPASNRLLLLSLYNCAIASAIVYKQSDAINNVMNILLRIQKKIDNGTISLRE